MDKKVLDSKQWRIAVARLEGIRSNIPSSISEDCVRDYEGLIDSLESASDEKLFDFRIPSAAMKPHLISASRSTMNHPIPRKQYSDECYCDDALFRRKIDGLWSYVLGLRSIAELGGVPLASKDYWSMSDEEMEQLAYKFNIPSHDVTGGGMVYLARDRIIDSLVKRDNALRMGASPAPSQVIDVEI